MDIDARLLQKFFNGDCTPEEMEIIKDYLKQSDHALLHRLLQSDWEQLAPGQASNEKEKKEVWEGLKPLINQGDARPKRMFSTWRKTVTIAATIVGFLMVSTFLFIQHRSRDAFQVVQNHGVRPLQIHLEDGSKVRLTPGSEIQISPFFSDNQRLILLKGNAHFEVAHDPDRTFLVKTKSLSTKVLGTIFKVKAFPSAEEAEVVLFAGQVSVEQNLDNETRALDTLAPGHKLIFHKTTQQFQTQPLEASNAYQWNGPFIQFEGANIPTVCEVLEDWYDVQIEVDPSLIMGEKLVHRIDTRSMGIADILEGINLVAKHHEYNRINDSTYVVRNK